VDDIDSVDANQAPAPLLMCLIEEVRGGMGVDEKVSLGMIVICPSTGDVVWDDFVGQPIFCSLYFDRISRHLCRWTHAYRT